MSASSNKLNFENWQIIVATDWNYGIGYQGGMPWGRLSGDMQHFKRVTTKVRNKEKQNAIVMGRVTWESMGKAAPLPGRLNIVVSSTLVSSQVIVCKTMSEVEELVNSSLYRDLIEKVFVIGGVKMYEEAVLRKAAKVWHTQIEDEFTCDKFLPRDIFDNYRFLCEKTKKHIQQYEEKKIVYTIFKYWRKKD